MLFGVLCTWAVAYGAMSIFKSLTLAFLPAPPPDLADVTEYVAGKLDDLRVNDMLLVNGEGILDATRRFILADTYPPLKELSNENLQLVLYKAYLLTDIEVAELGKMLAPVVVFEQWSGKLPETLKDGQRALALAPIVDYLLKIPPIRQEKP